LHPLALIEYSERKKKPWYFKSAKEKPNSLETLVKLHKEEITLGEAFLQTSIAPRTLKQTLTLWGPRIELLKQTLESQETKDVKAARLDISVRQLNRLLHTYLVPKAHVELPYSLNRKQARAKWGVRRSQALRVLRGDSTVVAAAQAIDLSERQMHRWMDKTLKGQFDLGLQVLRALPKCFRYALATEIETEHAAAAAHLIGYWREHSLKSHKMPETSEAWARADTRRCLIGLFLGEVTFDVLCAARETPKKQLASLLTSNLVPLGVSWEQAGAFSVHHQETLAEILNALDKPEAKPKKNLPKVKEEAHDGIQLETDRKIREKA